MNRFKIKALSLTVLGLGLMFQSCTDDESYQRPTTRPNKPLTALPAKSFALAEQARNAIVILDAATQQVVWEWTAVEAKVPAGFSRWFVGPTEAKPVYNNKYILMTASGGAVALIRIADKKLMFYANCGGNPHSAEMLPDGNIVTAESKNGEINTFVVDTVKVLGTKANTLKIGNAHNVIWSQEQQCLYATGTMRAGNTAVFRFKYNNDAAHPKLLNQKRIYTFAKENGGHDLYPVYGEKGKLWLTAAHAVYKIDVTRAEVTCDKIYDMPDIKGICNDAEGVYMLSPTEEWWAEGLINDKGEQIFRLNGSRIYKGRIMINQP